MDIGRLKKIVEQTGPRTVQEVVESQRSVELGVSTKKRRKTDRRTLAKRRQPWDKKWRNSHRYERTRYNATLVQQYYSLRREMRRRHHEWELTVGEWLHAWASCPAIEVGLNTWKPAWLCRGRLKTDVKIGRKDKSKSWNKDNIAITKEDQVLYP